MSFRLESNVILGLRSCALNSTIVMETDFSPLLSARRRRKRRRKVGADGSCTEDTLLDVLVFYLNFLPRFR